MSQTPFDLMVKFFTEGNFPTSPQNQPIQICNQNCAEYLDKEQNITNKNKITHPHTFNSPFLNVNGRHHLGCMPQPWLYNWKQPSNLNMVSLPGVSAPTCQLPTPLQEGTHDSIQDAKTALRLYMLKCKASWVWEPREDGG